MIVRPTHQKYATMTNEGVFAWVFAFRTPTSSHDIDSVSCFYGIAVELVPIEGADTAAEEEAAVRYARRESVLRC